MMTLLEAISPTARELMTVNFFAVGYSWNDPTFGELTGHTVIKGADAAAALQSFRSKNRQITRAWIIEEEKP